MTISKSMQKFFWFISIFGLVFSAIKIGYNIEMAKQPIIRYNAYSEIIEQPEEKIVTNEMDKNDIWAQDELPSKEQAHSIKMNLLNTRYFWCNPHLTGKIVVKESEIAVGQLSITSAKGSEENVQKYIKILVDLDPSYQVLTEFTTMNNEELINNSNNLQEVLNYLCSVDCEKLGLAELLAYDIFLDGIKQEKSLEWVDSKGDGLKALINWCLWKEQYSGWERHISPAHSDIENIVSIHEFWVAYLIKINSESEDVMDEVRYNVEMALKQY